MGHINQDFHLFQRELLIGLYESRSRKTQKTHLDARGHNSNQYVYEDNSSRTDAHDVKDQ